MASGCNELLEGREENLLESFERGGHRLGGSETLFSHAGGGCAVGRWWVEAGRTGAGQGGGRFEFGAVSHGFVRVVARVALSIGVTVESIVEVVPSDLGSRSRLGE